MRRRPVHAALVVLLAASAGIALANGCSATAGHLTTSSGTGGEAAGTGGHTATSSASAGGSGGGLFHPDGGTGGSGGAGGSGGIGPKPCGSKCGPVELCDPAHLGLDDNCNGLVDEGCPCTAGTAHSCFKGDPSHVNSPGCFPGTEICTEQGMWGACNAEPFASVHLKTGTGMFSANAVPGSEMYAVQCPMGVSQCPTVMAPDSYEAVQSGEYMVTYTKNVMGAPNPLSCTFPLFVSASGLRVELSWEHTVADTGVDLDLHLHKPQDTQPWGIVPAVEQDCMWGNCTVGPFLPPTPHWFADPPALPPTPVNWFNNIDPTKNTCYNDPKGIGVKWTSLGLGCHNPRLDADVITCDYSDTNPSHANFCTPENINIDYPPTGQWMRIGVHYYNNHGQTYDVHPEVKVFCNGALAADLGPQGYYTPQAPVTFAPADGAGMSGNRFWLVGDVAFSSDTCGNTLCNVQPLYGDMAQQTPLFTIDTTATSAFGPPYPPPP